MLFAASPFKERRGDFNVWGLCPPAEESGISRPSTGVHRRSRSARRYDAFGSERYVLDVREPRVARRRRATRRTTSSRSWRTAARTAAAASSASTAPSRPTASGRPTSSSTSSATTSRGSPTSTTPPTSPTGRRRPSASSPGSRTPPPCSTRRTSSGRTCVTPGTPLPTPWAKEEFEKTSREIQKRRREIRAAQRRPRRRWTRSSTRSRHETKLLGTDTHSGKVGAFEGAIYEAKGYYRPQADCIMFTRDEVPFCAVCRRAIDGRDRPLLALT